MKAKRKRKVGITGEAIRAAVKDGATSLTRVYKACGGSGCVPGSTAAKMRALVEDLDDKLKANRQAAKAGEVPKGAGKPGASGPAAAKPDAVAGDEKEAERLSPFRAGTKYDYVWRQLYLHRCDGVTRKSLLKKMEEAGVSDPKTGYYAITVIASPDESGTKAHKSVSGKPADLYWVEKLGDGLLKLHLRDREW